MAPKQTQFSYDVFSHLQTRRNVQFYPKFFLSLKRLRGIIGIVCLPFLFIPAYGPTQVCRSCFWLTGMLCLLLVREPPDHTQQPQDAICPGRNTPHCKSSRNGQNIFSCNNLEVEISDYSEGWAGIIFGWTSFSRVSSSHL